MPSRAPAVRIAGRRRGASARPTACRNQQVKTMQAVLVALFAALPALGAAQASMAAVNHVNWEDHPIHALDLSPDGRTLAVAHTADHRVLLYDVSRGFPVALGQVQVGLDPVSVRFRDDRELWVANHVSDSLSVVDVAARRVTATLATADEPHDVVFAGTPVRAFVSCSQANLVQVFDPAAPQSAPIAIPIDAEDPRAMAVSPDGRTVYVAVWESGNASTILAGASSGIFPPNVVRDRETPYGGVTPPPNDGDAFNPPRAAGQPPAPASGLIVRRDAEGRWRDGNQRDWTEFVSGASAARSGRVPGWDLPDRDLVRIDANTLAVNYTSGLMNIGMAVAVRPGDGRVTMVGTDARNEVRFEPNVRGRFVRVLLANVAGGDAAGAIDLNPQLDDSGNAVSAALRAQALGDPRGIVWSADGRRGYVAGMGSNNVVVLGASGARDGSVAPIEVGEGPTGLALDERHRVLYVWNHFEASLSAIDTQTLRERSRLAVYSPLPAAIRDGRRFLYDTRLTSGPGHLACASCHVDARFDRLAWDLGDPTDQPKRFDQNCITNPNDGQCEDFHPLKGPMTTQTLQDIIGKEPFHWRGDRSGIEEFNGAFVKLQGRAGELEPAQMQAFKDFLATIDYPPNPFRNADNSLPASVALPGLRSTGRFSLAGTPLPAGSAQRGLNLFRTGDLFFTPGGGTDNCRVCHSLPTGFGINGRISSAGGIAIGGRTLPLGPNGANHLAVTARGTGTLQTFKVPSLRNLHERIGFDLASANSRAGFGFLHDGSVDSLVRFLSLEDFNPRTDQDLADVAAFMLAFAGSDLPTANPQHSTPGPASRDTHASAGRQLQAGAGGGAALAQLAALAASPRLELVARAPLGERDRGWLYRRDSARFEPDDGGAALDAAALLAALPAGTQATFTLVPAGLGERLALDRDGDGVRDGVEFAQGSLPYDAASTTLRPAQGLWFNPARDGHGLDLQFAGDTLAVTWYTYLPDGEPVWYQAVGPYVGSTWTAPLNRFRLPAAGQPPLATAVGSMTLAFAAGERAELRWSIDGASGSEPLQRLRFGARTRSALHTGLWYDPADSGWGLSLDSQGEVTVVVVYFYDAAGAPRWTLGTLALDGSSAVQSSYRGFCPGCAAIPVRGSAGGEVGIVTGMDRRLQADVAVYDSATPAAVWRRNTQVVALSTVPADPWAQ